MITSFAHAQFHLFTLCQKFYVYGGTTFFKKKPRDNFIEVPKMANYASIYHLNQQLRTRKFLQHFAIFDFVLSNKNDDSYHALDLLFLRPCGPRLCQSETCVVTDRVR